MNSSSGIIPSGFFANKTGNSLENFVRRILIIECKWQQSGGSVDEKYSFLLWNIIKTAVPTIVILDGGGYKVVVL